MTDSSGVTGFLHGIATSAREEGLITRELVHTVLMPALIRWAWQNHAEAGLLAADLQAAREKLRQNEGVGPLRSEALDQVDAWLDVLRRTGPSGEG